MKSLQSWFEEKKLTKEENKQLCLTEEQVRSHPMFRNSTSEEIQNIISTLHTLSLLTYELFAAEVSENEKIMLAA